MELNHKSVNDVAVDIQRAVGNAAKPTKQFVRSSDGKYRRSTVPVKTAAKVESLSK